jgi:hypothetical protein
MADTRLAAILLLGAIGVLQNVSPNSNSTTTRPLGMWALDAVMSAPNQTVSGPGLMGDRLLTVTETGWTILDSGAPNPPSGVRYGGTYQLAGAQFVFTVEFADPTAPARIKGTLSATVERGGGLAPDAMVMTGEGGGRTLWERLSDDEVQHRPDSEIMPRLKMMRIPIQAIPVR